MALLLDLAKLLAKYKIIAANAIDIAKTIITSIAIAFLLAIPII